MDSMWENEAEQSTRTLGGPWGASSGEMLVERGVDEFVKRRRTAVDGLREPQYCYDFTMFTSFAAWDALGV